MSKIYSSLCRQVNNHISTEEVNFFSTDTTIHTSCCTALEVVVGCSTDGSNHKGVLIISDVAGLVVGYTLK